MSENEEGLFSPGEMETEDLMSGLGFLMGTLERMDSNAYLHYLQREISKFLSTSRSETEIRLFQSKLYQSLEVFNSLRAVMPDTGEENEVKTRTEEVSR